MTDAPESGWFNEIAAFLGPAYWAPDTGRVASFTTGTEQEADFLVDELGLRPGAAVLDLGCGPGRHALALARRGCRVHGIDLSEAFIDLAVSAAAQSDASATFAVGDVAALDIDAVYDAAICLCQGGFGLLGGRESVDVLAGFARALRPGGMLAVSAFSSYFAVSAMEAGERFDAATGVLQERSTLENPAGRRAEFDLWTTCFTPRELTLLAEGAGLEILGLYSVVPGSYERRALDLEHPEFLLVARRPDEVPDLSSPRRRG